MQVSKLKVGQVWVSARNTKRRLRVIEILKNGKVVVENENNGSQKTLLAESLLAQAPEGFACVSYPRREPSMLTTISVKLLPEDREKLKARAMKRHKGNVSALLRDAGLNYLPRKKQA